MSSLTDYLKLIKPARLEKYNVNNFNDNFDSLDKAIEKLPRGVMLAKSRSASSSPMSNANLDATNPVTLKGGRMYKFTYDSRNITTNADTTYQINLYKCATTDSNISVDNLTALGLKNGGEFKHITANYTESAGFTAIIPQVADETFQMKVTYQRTAGTGNIVCIAMNFVLEDIGPNIGANL